MQKKGKNEEKERKEKKKQISPSRNATQTTLMEHPPPRLHRPPTGSQAGLAPMHARPQRPWRTRRNRLLMIPSDPRHNRRNERKAAAAIVRKQKSRKGERRETSSKQLQRRRRVWFLKAGGSDRQVVDARRDTEYRPLIIAGQGGTYF